MFEELDERFRDVLARLTGEPQRALPEPAIEYVDEHGERYHQAALPG